MTNRVSTTYKADGKSRVFALPVKPISRRHATQLIRERAKDNGDRFLLAGFSATPKHDVSTVATKLRALNGVASANVRSVQPLAKCLAKWDKTRPGGLKKLISSGNPTDANRLIRFAKKSTKIWYVSAISKYLAYHANGKWPIYDQWVRQYLWALVVTIDRDEYFISRGYYLSAPPGWSGLTTSNCLRNYETYYRTIEQLWIELALPSKLISIRDKEYLFWRLAQKRATLYSGAKRYREPRLR